MWVNKKHNNSHVLRTAKSQYGFTIVESLIVLAVTGAIFISSASLIAGQVGRNQAKQAADSLEIYARDVLNDVATGYYPDVGISFTCTNGGINKPTVSVSGSKPLGSNPNCLFAGKKITFTNTGIQVDSVVANASKTLNTISDPNNQLTVVPELSQTIPYSFGLRHTGPNKEYYVLNRLLSPSDAQETSFVGGGQGVSVVSATGGSASATGFIVCFDNGGTLARLTLAAKNSTNADVEQGVATCIES